MQSLSLLRDVLPSVSRRGGGLSSYFMSSGKNYMDKEHDDQDGAKGTNNRSPGGKIKQHRKIHTERGHQGSHNPTNRQPPADAVSEEHGSNRRHHQITEYEQHTRNRDRRSDHKSKGSVKQKIPETNAHTFSLSLFRGRRNQQELMAENVMKNADDSVKNRCLGNVVHRHRQ